MKNISFIYESFRQMQKILQENAFSLNEEYLIQIHTCIHTSITIQPFIQRIRQLLPNAKIVGSSTSGVIYRGNILTDCCMISITAFSYAKLETRLTLITENMSGTDLACQVSSNLLDETAKFMLTFYAGRFLKIDEFVDYINTYSPHVHMLGGVANTPEIRFFDMKKLKSFVFNESGVSNQAMAYAVVKTKKLSVYQDIIYVTEPVGNVHTITEAEGAIIRSIDGENTVHWYQRMLGIDLESENSKDIPVVFPLVKASRGNFPWAMNYSKQYNVFENEPEPVMFALSEARVGDKVRISYSSVQKTIEVCESVCERIHQHPAEVLFGYSCVSRQDMFRNCAKWELLPFAKSNLCGALVAGEIANFGDLNCFCTYSFSIAALAEDGGKTHLDITALKDHAGDLINNQENVIDYLLRITNDQNEEVLLQQQEIKTRLFIDQDTGLGNITKFQFDYSLGNFDKLCMITIRNESLLKAFLSASKFQSYFNRYHKKIQKFCSEPGYSCYVYKETALLLTASNEIPDDAFSKRMMDLQIYLSEYKFDTYVPVCEFSLVIREENLIEKAELTLIRMRTRKNCFLVYTSELGLEQKNVQKMRMILILNDAISNNRVIPYYQGIRDNETGEIALYESLMRLEDSNGNIYLPGQFLDIAREYGYYPDLSYMMISKVLHAFRDQKVHVTINMNINDLYNYKTVHRILEYLESAPHPENYIFEITETEEIEDYQVICEFADQIHRAGGQIAIDDFGSGFSNMVHLFRIPSDLIKIDGEIIRNICTDTYVLEFLEMICKWAHKHKKKVVAEFVENEMIQQLVEENHIRYSQGYLYSKPTRLFE
jgi:EAL domain-containing protein (putative c-di-GMP-specific phosphodiesterase class I)